MRVRVVVGVLVAAVGVAGLGARVATADAATVTLKLSASTVWFGGTVSATVTSSEAGTVSLYQLRSAARQSGPGRCNLDSGYVDGYVRRKPVTSIAVKANTPVVVRLAGSKLAYFDGNLADGLLGSNASGCFDPPTQFTRLGAFFGATEQYDFGHDVRPLTRTL